MLLPSGLRYARQHAFLCECVSVHTVMAYSIAQTGLMRILTTACIDLHTHMHRLTSTAATGTAMSLTSINIILM
jgi:hypothetical protein